MLKFIQFAKELVAANSGNTLLLLDMLPIATYVKQQGADVHVRIKGRKDYNVYQQLASILDDALTEVDATAFGTWAIIVAPFGNRRHALLIRTLAPEYCTIYPQSDDEVWSFVTLNGATLLPAVLPDLVGGPDAVREPK